MNADAGPVRHLQYLRSVGSPPSVINQVIGETARPYTRWEFFDSIVSMGGSPEDQLVDLRRYGLPAQNVYSMRVGYALEQRAAATEGQTHWRVERMRELSRQRALAEDRLDLALSLHGEMAMDEFAGVPILNDPNGQGRPGVRAVIHAARARANALDAQIVDL